MPDPMLVLADGLDPRPASLAGTAPHRGWVNIPADELAARIHELPPRCHTLRVLEFEPWARQALVWLRAHGRLPEPCPPPPPTTAAAAGPPRLWRPSEFLESVAPRLPSGRALDLACGSGRDAVYLADRGWGVVALDWLPDALALGQSLAARYAPSTRIEWRCADIEHPDFRPPGEFDLIHVARFLHRPLLARLGAWLRPGGHLLYETFTTTHLERNDRPARPEHLLQPGELPAHFPMLAIRQHDEAWRGAAQTARIWATRRVP